MHIYSPTMHLRQALVVALLLSLLSLSLAHSLLPEHNRFLLLPSSRKLRPDDSLYCPSWQFSVEVNNAGEWSTVPQQCEQHVQQYMEGEAYLSDSYVTAQHSLEFAKTVQIAGDGKDVWIFDIDETLLSNLDYYRKHEYGAEVFNENEFDVWERQAKAPALPASLSLYKQVQQLGFTIILLTGRDEPFRKFTEDNLKAVGYDNWERLILRGPEDQGKEAVIYKSEQRQALVDEGYRIRGNSGDQWSDLLGYAVAERSFKHPNPMYYIA